MLTVKQFSQSWVTVEVKLLRTMQIKLFWFFAVLGVEVVEKSLVRLFPQNFTHLKLKLLTNVETRFNMVSY